VRSQAQRAEDKGQLYLLRRKVGHAKTPGTYNDRPKQSGEIQKISHPQNEQINKPAQKPAGLLSLNSPQSQPKHGASRTGRGTIFGGIRDKVLVL
jgi:hypothetical protein